MWVWVWSRAQRPADLLVPLLQKHGLPPPAQRAEVEEALDKQGVKKTCIDVCSEFNGVQDCQSTPQATLPFPALCEEARDEWMQIEGIGTLPTPA